MEPLSPARYKVQFTASAELRDKLERLQALMRSSEPDIDLAGVIEDAVTEKLERLEARRYGKTKAPRKRVEETDTAPSSRYVPAAVRRAVYERDGGRCTFVDQEGRRCTERGGLEFDHDRPFGLGGDHGPENIHLKCRTHNLYRAERTYGKVTMAHYRSSGDRVSEPRAFYGLLRTRTRSRRSSQASGLSGWSVGWRDKECDTSPWRAGELSKTSSAGCPSSVMAGTRRTRAGSFVRASGTRAPTWSHAPPV